MALTRLIAEMEQQILKGREKESEKEVKDHGGKAEDSGRTADRIPQFY